MPPPSRLASLSGTVEASTRVPGTSLRTEGSVGSAQARATIDGPLGEDAGFLLSLRSGFPGIVAPSGEPSYLRGETGDGIAKLELPVRGGRLRLLGYTSDNELGAAATAEVAGNGRHRFSWKSRSVGAAWTRTAGTTVHVQAWSASADTRARWLVPEDVTSMSSIRRDLGLLGSIELRDASASSAIGLRLERIRVLSLRW